MGSARIGGGTRLALAGFVVATVWLTSAVLAGCSSASRSGEPAASPDAPKEGTSVFGLSSPAFEDGGLIPVQFANTGVEGGENMSTPYEWRGAPDSTQSFALVLVDRHPRARSWVHWMVTRIPASTSALNQGISGRSMPAGAIEHLNTFGRPGYGGPQPPVGSGKHEYEAIVYALDTSDVGLSEQASLDEFTAAISGHVLTSASYSGVFGR